jgi:predicted site-specific integrase-resolvase
MKLSQWAKQQGLTYQTAWNLFKQNKLPIPAQQLETGTIIVHPEQKITSSLKTYIYCRVSSHNKKDDLERQAQRCIDFCSSRGYEISKVVKEVASGMNDSRPKLIDIVSLPPKRIIVEHKDRLTRFGFNYIEHFLSILGFELIVVNRDQEEKNELMNDLISIITSFCCRIYGARKTSHKVQKIKEELKNE